MKDEENKGIDVEMKIEMSNEKSKEISDHQQSNYNLQDSLRNGSTSIF
jgi:hypothetical protein